MLKRVSGGFEHSVLSSMGNLWFVRPIDCSVKHLIFQSINFHIHATRNVQAHLKSTVIHLTDSSEWKVLVHETSDCVTPSACTQCSTVCVQ